LIGRFSDFRYVDQFRSYLRSKSKVVRNLAEIWTFFALPKICWGRPFRKLYIYYHARHAPRCVVKFRKVTPTNPEIIGTHMLNFKPNF